jgi:hypothetical protein
LAYQPPASSTFLSQQTSHQQSASSTFLSEQISTSHQTPAKRTGYKLKRMGDKGSPTKQIWSFLCAPSKKLGAGYSYCIGSQGG